MTRAPLLVAAGIVAAGAGAWTLWGGAPPASPTVAEPDPAPETAAADAPPAPPRLVGTSEAAAERKARALVRAGLDWEEIVRLLAEGKAKEALALLEGLRGRAPEFVADPAHAGTATRIEGLVRAADAERRLVDASRGLKLSDAQRAALEGRLAATAEVIARAQDQADVDRLTRHLARFVVPDGVVSSGGGEGGDWADVALRSFVADRRARREKDKNPAVADAEAAEARRLEQLEKLRQRDAVGLLDSIHAGLAWLAIHQRDDGSFCDAATLERCGVLKHSPTCLDKWPSTGDAFAVANTALVAIAFLDFRDQDPNGWFDPYLGRALEWLGKQQKPDGSWPGAGQLYSTAMATMALGQAAASTGSADLLERVKKAVAFFSTAQGPFGGFRYRAGDPLGDLSVTGWVAQALEAARHAGVEVPLPLSDGLARFVQYVWVDGARFQYVYRQGVAPRLAPVGMLVGHLDWPSKKPELVDAWRAYLQGLPADKPPDLYGLYYGVRVSILLTGALEGPWRTWVFALAARQVHGNQAAGSFPGDLWRWSGGVSVQTAVAVLTMEHALYLR